MLKGHRRDSPPLAVVVFPHRESHRQPHTEAKYRLIRPHLCQWRLSVAKSDGRSSHFYWRGLTPRPETIGGTGSCLKKHLKINRTKPPRRVAAAPPPSTTRCPPPPPP